MVTGGWWWLCHVVTERENCCSCRLSSQLGEERSSHWLSRTGKEEERTETGSESVSQWRPWRCCSVGWCRSVGGQWARWFSAERCGVQLQLPGHYWDRDRSQDTSGPGPVSTPGPPDWPGTRLDFQRRGKSADWTWWKCEDVVTC